MTSRVLVLDLGFYSLGWLCVDSGRYDADGSGHSPAFSLSCLIEDVEEEVRSSMDGARLGRDYIDSLICSGKKYTYVRGKKVNIFSMVDDAIRRRGKGVLDAIVNSVKSDDKDIDVVLITGGGALFSSWHLTVQGKFKSAKILTLESPITASALGFYRMAIQRARFRRDGWIP